MNVTSMQEDISLSVSSAGVWNSVCRQRIVGGNVVHVHGFTSAQSFQVVMHSAATELTFQATFKVASCIAMHT